MKTFASRETVQVSDDLDSGMMVALQQVKEAASRNGIDIQLQTFVIPGWCWFRAIAKDLSSGEVVGQAVGWQVPFTSTLHLDALRIRPQKEQSGEKRSLLGIGLYLGSAIFAWAVSRNFTRGELLAIDDDYYTHQRLVKYYKRYGFVEERYVGNSGLKDVPDLLVWGGAGTLMSGELNTMHKRWSRAIVRQLE